MQKNFSTLFTLMCFSATATTNETAVLDASPLAESPTQKLWSLLKNTKSNPEAFEKDLLTKTNVFLLLLEGDNSEHMSLSLEGELELLATSFKKVNSSLEISYVSPESLKIFISQKDNEELMRNYTFSTNQETSLSLLFAPVKTQLRLFEEREAAQSIFPNLITIWVPGSADPIQESTHGIKTFSEHDPTNGSVTKNPEFGKNPIDHTNTRSIPELIGAKSQAIN